MPNPCLFPVYRYVDTDCVRHRAVRRRGDPNFFFENRIGSSLAFLRLMVLTELFSFFIPRSVCVDNF